MRAGVPARRGEAAGSSRPARHSQRGHLGPPSSLSILTRQERHSSPGSTHFLLAGFSLFSPPFELLKGDLPFQVVDELWAEPRHVCKVQGRGPKSPEREPEGQRLPDSTPPRDAETEDPPSYREMVPAGAAAAALGFRRSAWPHLLPAGAFREPSGARPPALPASWPRPPACHQGLGESA